MVLDIKSKAMELIFEMEWGRCAQMEKMEKKWLLMANCKEISINVRRNLRRDSLRTLRDRRMKLVFDGEFVG